MKVIYGPQGKACNLFHGCPHGCRYCYAPGATRTEEPKGWLKVSTPNK